MNKTKKTKNKTAACHVAEPWAQKLIDCQKVLTLSFYIKKRLYSFIYLCIIW